MMQKLKERISSLEREIKVEGERDFESKERQEMRQKLGEHADHTGEEDGEFDEEEDEGISSSYFR